MDLGDFIHGFEFLAWVSGISTVIFVISTFCLFDDRSDYKWITFTIAAVSAVIFLISGFFAFSL